METTAVFAERLGKLITSRLKTTGTEFAAEAGVSQSVVLGALSGQDEAIREIVPAIMAHYPDHLYWLLTGKEKLEHGSALPPAVILGDLFGPLRAKSVNPGTKKDILVLFMKKYVSGLEDGLDARKSIDLLKAVFVMFHLDVSDAELVSILKTSMAPARAA